MPVQEPSYVPTRAPRPSLPLSLSLCESHGGRALGVASLNLADDEAGAALAFTRYCDYQYCVLNDKTGGQGEHHILRNIDRVLIAKYNGGGAIKEMLNATNSID